MLEPLPGVKLEKNYGETMPAPEIIDSANLGKKMKKCLLAICTSIAALAAANAAGLDLVLITGGAWQTRANPKAIVGYREAMAEALAYIRANRDDANGLAAEHLKPPKAVVDNLPIPDWRMEVPAPALLFWMDVSPQFGLIKQPLNAASMIVR